MFISPATSMDSYISFLEVLASISSFLDKSSNSSVVILGDMNAHPNRGQHWDALQGFVDEYNFCIADLLQLSDDSYTFLSARHNIVTWIDHIITSNVSCISDVNVQYEKTVLDHFPLACSIIF